MSATLVPDVSSHEHFFSFVNSDDLLNEFLWRADPRISRMKHDIDQQLQITGFSTLYTETNITPQGVYINVKDHTINRQIFHLSFHLMRSYAPQPPGAFHARNNFTHRGVYQMFYVVQRSSACNPGATNGLNLIRSRFFPSSYSSICGRVEPAINVILSVVNRYFKQPTEPLSLYHDLTGRRATVHPQLMPIIRTRPRTLTRTALTAGLRGGAKSRRLHLHRHDVRRRHRRPDISTRRRRPDLSRTCHNRQNP
jgi:hypothetical protein